MTTASSETLTGQNRNLQKSLFSWLNTRQSRNDDLNTKQKLSKWTSWKEDRWQKQREITEQMDFTVQFSRLKPAVDRKRTYCSLPGYKLLQKSVKLKLHHEKLNKNLIWNPWETKGRSLMSDYRCSLRKSNQTAMLTGPLGTKLEGISSFKSMDASVS